MKNLAILLSLFVMVSCTRVNLINTDELMIAPVLIDGQTASLIPRLDLLAELGFNTVVFIGAGVDMWSELTLQAHGRELYSVFMTDVQEPEKVVDYLLSSGVEARIDGVWLSQGNYFDRPDIKKIQHALKTLKSQVKDRKILGQLFIQSNEASTVSLLQNGKLMRDVVYYDHSAAGLLGTMLSYGGGEDLDPNLMGSNIAKMYNWRNFYAKSGYLLVPLTLNFSYAFAQPPVSLIAMKLMNSISGPLYLPIALSAIDQTFYQDDLAILKNILRIRKENPSLFRGKQSNLAYNNGVYIDLKESTGEQILVILNLTPAAIQYRLPYLGTTKLKKNARLKNIEDGRAVQISGAELSLPLRAYEASYWRVEKK